MSYSLVSRGTFPCCLRRLTLVLSCVALLLGCISAQQRASVAADASVTYTAGTLPVFTDGSGDLGDSLLSQVSTATGGAGNFVGINTTAPLADLHILGVNPTMRIEQYGPVGSGDSPNFNFFTGNGTAAAPTATLDKDNLGQFAATGFDGTAFGGSKAKVSFVAVGNWTPTANGAAMSFQTTSSTDTSLHRTERMRIGDNGNVGIGDFSVTPPPFPLTVNGIIQSTLGGFMFPNGTVQLTAAVSGAPTPVVCAAGQLLSWNGSSWACAALPGVTTLALTTNSGLGVSSLTGNVLTLGVDTTVQRTLASGCTGNSAINSISQTGVVTCETVSGGGAVSLPVNWSSSFTPNSSEQGVLNVINTANGPAPPNGTPPNSFFATVPAAVVGTAKGTGITGGVAGLADGTEGVGVFAYTATSSDGAILAWNGLTGFTGTNDYPKTVSAMLANETGGSVIKAEATAATGPAVCSGSNCQQLTGVDVSMDATSGVTVGFSANLNSPASQGLNLNFAVAPTSGWMINAGVNCSGSGSCPYFQVDGSGDINASGGLTTNGTSTLNGLVNISNGLNLTGSLTSNGGANFQNLTISNDLSANNLNATTLTVANTVENLTVGNLNVTGNLSKSSGNFKIDHPLDPANKFLYHSFVESPDMMNIYNGNIVTDKHGVATVELPDYFEALNQDFRYQLTVIGQFAQAIVVKEISKNHFTIKTNKPSVKVSWQVTGVRHDAYAEAHRIVVEEDKGKERGTYLHPELFQKDPVVAQK
jgi:hypothetical protein